VPAATILGRVVAEMEGTSRGTAGRAIIKRGIANKRQSKKPRSGS
jgi:hypothetical protein